MQIANHFISDRNIFCLDKIINCLQFYYCQSSFYNTDIFLFSPA